MLWYFVGSTVVELSYVLFTDSIFTAFFFPMVGFTDFSTGFSADVLFWLSMSLMVLYHTFLGQLLAFALPSMEVAIVSGFSSRRSSSFSWATVRQQARFRPISSGSTLSPPHRYALSNFVVLVFADCPSNATFDSSAGEFVNVGSEIGCQPLTNAPIALGNITIKQFIEQVFEIKHNDIATNFVALIGIAVLFRILTLLCFRFVNYKKS